MGPFVHLNLALDALEQALHTRALSPARGCSRGASGRESRRESVEQRAQPQRYGPPCPTHPSVADDDVSTRVEAGDDRGAAGRKHERIDVAPRRGRAIDLRAGREIVDAELLDGETTANRHVHAIGREGDV